MDTQAHAIYDGFIEGFKSAGYDKFAAEGYIDVLQKIANEYDIMLDALADTQKDPNFRYKIAGFLTKVAFGEPSQDPTEGTFHDPRLIEAQTGGAITPGAPESSWKAKARELANRAASGQSDMLHNPATWLGGGGGALLGLLLGGQSQSPILKMLLPLLLGAVGAGVGNHFGSQIGGAANKMLGEAPQPTAHLNSPSLSEAAPGATIKPTSLQMGMSPEEATKATAPRYLRTFPVLAFQMRSAVTPSLKTT